jgi:hypothetical protein
VTTVKHAVPRTVETLRRIAQLYNVGTIGEAGAFRVAREVVHSMEPAYLHEHFAEIAEIVDGMRGPEGVMVFEEAS